MQLKVSLSKIWISELWQRAFRVSTGLMLGWDSSSIRCLLPWVCFKRGVYYGQVDAYGTSQECPDCETKVKKDLSVRISHCHECGSIKPRDIAASQVINARGQSGIETVCGWDLSGSGMNGADLRMFHR